MFDLRLEFLDVFFGQLNFQFLVFYLFGEGVKFPVVTNILLLLAVFFDQGFGVLDHVLFGRNLVVYGFDIGLELVYPGF